MANNWRMRDGKCRVLQLESATSCSSSARLSIINGGNAVGSLYLVRVVGGEDLIKYRNSGQRGVELI